MPHSVSPQPSPNLSKDTILADAPPPDGLNEVDTKISHNGETKMQVELKELFDDDDEDEDEEFSSPQNSTDSKGRSEAIVDPM